jgi:NitT/TauT family transport system substrate-binding protein
VVRFVLTQPPDRVSYRMLNPSDQEMEKIRDMGIQAGILTARTPMSDLLDRSFIPSDIKPADIDMTSAGKSN